MAEGGFSDNFVVNYQITRRYSSADRTPKTVQLEVMNIKLFLFSQLLCCSIEILEFVEVIEEHRSREILCLYAGTMKVTVFRTLCCMAAI